MLHTRNVVKAQNPNTVQFFPQNNCIYSYYVLFQDSANRVSANRVSENRDWTKSSVNVYDKYQVSIMIWAPRHS